MQPRVALVIFALALLLRLGFVAWAPGEPTGDGFFYHLYAYDLLAGNGYVNVDRSPANSWMPGWPAFLAGVYALFGPRPVAGMAVNAFLGALTALGVARLGTLLFSRRIGSIGGGLYAVWPGLVYYAATLYNESLFSLLMVLTFNLVVDADRAEQRRPLRFALAGLALGACAMVKAEPLLFGVSFALYFWVGRRNTRQLVREAGLCFSVTLMVVLPWTVRNYRTFDRFIPTAAGGGMVVAAANHPGASGGNDLGYLIAYAKQLGVEEETQAQQNIAINDHAWGDALAFAQGNPGEQLLIMARKLRLTYSGDAGGAELVRGYFGPEKWHLSEVTWRRLARVADAWWLLLVIPFAIGLARSRSWPGPTRILILGPLATWLLLHLVFLGGARFHVPELILHSLIVAGGIDWLLVRLQGQRG